MRICKNCGKEYEKNKQFSLTQWNRSKYCSIQCAGNAKKINDGMSRFTRYRRRRGALKQGTPEWLERIKARTVEAMLRPEVQEKIRAKRSPLTKEHRDKISGKLKWRMPSFIPKNEGEANHFWGRIWTDEMKKTLSDKLAGKMPKNMMIGSNGAFPNVKRGYYDINGKNIYFRSKWEANYALYLDFLVKQNQIRGWDFEPDTFVFHQIQFGTRSYTPDFRVIENNNKVVYHEVKGYMDSKSKTKLKRMGKYYPEIKLILIERPFYMDLVRKLGKTLNFW